MVITSGWAFAVMAAVFTAIACGSSDAHLNLAVTTGFAVSSGEFAKFAPYLIAQMAGAFLGAGLVWLHFLPHWKETSDQGLNENATSFRSAETGIYYARQTEHSTFNAGSIQEGAHARCTSGRGKNNRKE